MLWNGGHEFGWSCLRFEVMKILRAPHGPVLMLGDVLRL